MELTSRRMDGVVVVDVIGEVKGSTDEEDVLNSTMSNILSRGEDLVVVNLDSILSLDESAMRMLLRVCGSVLSNGGRMAFVRSIAKATIDREPSSDRESSSDKDRLVFESESSAIEALKKRSTEGREEK